jgi:8-amino-7-oxononanoate synthase
MNEQLTKIQEILQAQKSKKEKMHFGVGQEFLQKQKLALQQMGVRNPYFACGEALNQNRMVIDGKEYINYASYDYLGLSSHPHVHARVNQAIKQFGTSCSASRLAGGERTIHRELEEIISKKLLNVDDALVFIGGYTTNVSTIEHLLTPKDLIIYDALVHNSILKGCVFSGARRLAFAHNDCQALEKILQEQRGQYEKTLIIVEGVYSMDGDFPDLARMIELKKKYGAHLMVDEAHSMGVIGKTGKGISEHLGIDARDVDIWMGTLSKAFASCGGYIAGSGDLIDYLKYTTPGFVYSVGISPSNTASALGAIEVLLQEPERARLLQERSALFRKLCLEKGFNIGKSKDSPVVPVIVGSSEKALLLADALFQAGVHALPLFYPVVEEKAARLRFFLTALHTEEEIRETVEKVAEASQK